MPIYNERSDTRIQPVPPPTTATSMINVLGGAHGTWDARCRSGTGKRESQVTMQDVRPWNLRKAGMGVGIYLFNKVGHCETATKEVDEKNIVRSKQPRYEPISCQVFPGVAHWSGELQRPSRCLAQSDRKDGKRRSHSS
ncbi:hypothetical protein PMIN04_002954 [Paraphaeosphaeria minitans]